MGKPYLKIIFLKGSQDKETQMKRISHDLWYKRNKIVWFAVKCSLLYIKYTHIDSVIVGKYKFDLYEL